MADKDQEKREGERQRFLQSILNRGPNKRQIKPAENSPLLQFALGDSSEDSEEDEDFEFNDEEEVSGSDEEDVDVTGPVSSAMPVRGTNNADDSDDSDSEDDPKGPTLSVADLIAAMTSKTDRKPVPLKHSSDVIICGICMDDVSDEGDEIVGCDNCGITVHEGCYGTINEETSDSHKSNETDSPTEPWFCDACKAGVQPDCELCPNLGGIFKETDTFQWVHLLCALYTPGIAFVKPETLESVTLSELPHYKWGARECSLCEDERFSRTGVCIGCDAGMCKTYFHVTCAQMYGLLSDVPEECDEDVADPLYAHCKQHADKETTKSRRRGWLAYNAHYKKFSERKTPEDKERINGYLVETQKRIKAEAEENRALMKPYTPTEKMPRMLSTCPGACRQLYKKAKLLGFTTEQTQSVVSARRKWFIPPALTCDFVNYYNDRDTRVKEMQERQIKLENNNKQLQEEEQLLHDKVEKLNKDLQGLTGTLRQHRDEGVLLHQLLSRLAQTEFTLPAILESKKPKRKTSESAAKHIQIHSCATCKRTENQHLMAECDTCHSFYHMACVDPPLTRMPRKSAKCLWQCSECDPSESEEEVEVNIEDNTPISQSRQRRTIKEPTKFTPDKGEPKKHKRKRKPSIDVTVSVIPMNPDEQSTPSTENAAVKQIINAPTIDNPAKKQKMGRPKVSKRKEYVKKERVLDQRKECSQCKKPGDNNSLVRCDNCKLCYHFACLDPPVKCNPKRRGYMWYCTECDESDEGDEEEEQEVNERTTTEKATESGEVTVKQEDSQKEEQTKPSKET